jgi:hypothetical protein
VSSDNAIAPREERRALAPEGRPTTAKQGQWQCRPVPLVERFWRHVTPPALLTDCWEWRGYTDPGGYGRVMGENGYTVMAHRASFEMFYGDIPAGLKVLHRCDNRRCVSPDHLFLGTQLDNIADMVAKGRQARGECLAAAIRAANPDRRGERNGRAKLTGDDVRAIRRAYEAGSATPATLARRYGVADTVIHNIVRYRSWKHIAKESSNVSK